MQTLVTFMRKNTTSYFTYSYEFYPFRSHSAAHRNYPWSCRPNRWVYGDIPRIYREMLRKGDHNEINNRST